MPGGSLATAYYAGMSETTAEQAASLNGSAPDDAKPCEDCVSGGEKVMALIAGLFGVFIIVMAFDMFSGGRLAGYVKERRGDE